MRVVIDCSNLGGRGGIEKYTKSLVRQLTKKSDKIEYILLADNSPMWEGLKKRLPHRTWHNHIPLVSRHVFLAVYLYALRPDLVFSPSGQIPLLYFGKSIITIHDLAIYKSPNWFPSRQWLSTKVITPWSIKKAKRVIAVSESTVADLHQLMNTPIDKTRVISEAPTGKWWQDSFLNKKDYILFVGTIEPRKNISRILKAFARLIKKEEFANYTLLLAGKKGWRYTQIFKTYEKLGLKDKVKFLGYIDEPYKRKLYEQAKLFIWPSLYEGFGLPILEAQRAGLVVVTSNVSSMPEVAGSGAMLVDPKSVNSIYQAINRLLSDEGLRRTLIQKGYENAKKFSWEKTAQETEKVFQEILEK